jgi:hypothetical protein
LKKYIYLFALIAGISACSKNGGSNNSCGTFSFSADVQPIINSSCATSSSCHAAGSVNSGGPLTDWAKVSAQSSKIKFQVENGLMPKVGLLTADQKNKIICWINSGASNN